jgi:DnaJ-class molecular chaperone
MGTDLYDCPECNGTGALFRSDCCGAALPEEHDFNHVCPACGEDCEMEPCEECEGTGSVPP